MNPGLIGAQSNPDTTIRAGLARRAQAESDTWFDWGQAPVSPALGLYEVLEARRRAPTFARQDRPRGLIDRIRERDRSLVVVVRAAIRSRGGGNDEALAITSTTFRNALGRLLPG